jgi:superfamily II DNA or RNA helicase
LALEAEATPWSFTADGGLFRLVSEASRISLAHLFDPFLAVQTSTLTALPHQIDAVYNRMVPLHPLRFLLADDPGAGKTIMAGLLLKELIIRGDVERCLVIAPGSLVEQWQDELWRRFHVGFEILTPGTVEASRTGNPFQERNLLIARLDMLARNEELQAKLGASEWDLIVVDEAHKMSARYDGPNVRPTRRYRLGRLAGSVTRHFLLMTATPHNGKEEEFQLFLALLDPDQFEGRPAPGRHAEPRDLMRRLVKERLLRLDGRPLFPERLAYSPTFRLSDAEAALYEQVTTYVREEMNRAESLRGEGERRRGLAVGFALTTLQRRLASSPEAIYRSLLRRRERLEERLAEARRQRAESALRLDLPVAAGRHFQDDDDDFDPDDLPEAELEQVEEQLVDEATAARTVAELEWEIGRLRALEAPADRIRRSGQDRKWEELRRLIQEAPEMFDSRGDHRKLIVFTEHRDTLEYLVRRLTDLFGRAGSVVAIYGGMRREERRRAQESFVQDPDMVILVATDAAGEGVNLQRAHLMVNYDLPWNPNRVEQRFGRVHRIGQTEVPDVRQHARLPNRGSAATGGAEASSPGLPRLEVPGQGQGQGRSGHQGFGQATDPGEVRRVGPDGRSADRRGLPVGARAPSGAGRPRRHLEGGPPQRTGDAGRPGVGEAGPRGGPDARLRRDPAANGTGPRPAVGWRPRLCPQAMGRIASRLRTRTSATRFWREGRHWPTPW